MKKILFSLFTLLCLLASCTGQGKQQEEQTLKLRVGVMPSVDHLPLVVAWEQFYFDSLGLQVEFVNFNSPMERDATLQAGELDATISDYTTVMLQNQKGLPVQLLFATEGQFSFIASQPSGISSVEALKGKKVGLSSNTVIEYATDKLLADKGISPNEVNKVEVQKIPLRLEMLAKGELDAAVLPEPFVSIARQRGLTDLSNGLTVGGETLRITGLAVYTKDLEAKQEALKRLQKAYNRAVDYLNQTPQSAWEHILVAQLRVEEGLAKTMTFAPFSYADRPTKADISAVAEWLKAKGLIPAEYSGEEAVLSLAD